MIYDNEMKQRMMEKIQSITSPKQTKERSQYEQNDRESNNEERNALNA